MRPHNPIPDSLQTAGTDPAGHRQKIGRAPSSEGEISALSREDAEWIEQCRQGNTAAFGMLVRKYQDRVFNVCWRMCGHHADAEDLTQEAFVRAFLALDRFAEQSQFYTWIFRIAVNLIISARRKGHRSRSLSLDTPGRAYEDDGQGARANLLPSEVASPSQAAMDRETQRLVTEALATMEEDHRCVLVLRDMESLNYDEIAEIVDVPVGTVKSRLHRARLAMREILRPILKTS